MQMGGSASIVAALVRGIEKHGGRVLLSSHVEQVRERAFHWQLHRAIVSA